jgi:hypothetical protein
MVYLKSILSGIAASTSAFGVIYALGALIAVVLKNKHADSDAIFVQWNLHVWPVACIVLCVFVLGFYWELKRAAH